MCGNFLKRITTAFLDKFICVLLYAVAWGNLFSIAQASTSVTISPSVEPMGLGYDTAAAKLYSIAMNSAGKWVFGSIDPATGAFALGVALQPAVQDLVMGIPMSVRNSDPASGKAAHIFISRTDGLLDVDAGTGSVTVGPLPKPASPSGFGFDYLRNQMYGRTSGGIVSIDLKTGAEENISTDSYGGGLAAISSAIDPYKHVYYTFGRSSTSRNVIFKIDESTGAISQIPVSTSLIGLVFDPSTSAGSSVLYGVTDCAGSPCTNFLVNINTTSGGLQNIAAVGGSGTGGFEVPLATAINPDDRFFAATPGESGTTILISTKLPSSSSNKGKNLGDCDCNSLGVGTAEGKPIRSGVGNNPFNPGPSDDSINAGTGNKYRADTDFVGATATGLSLKRYYNSADTTDSAFGSKWHSTWHRGLSVVAGGGSITVTRADGRQDVFRKNAGGDYVSDADVTARLSALLDAANNQIGWRLTLPDDGSEDYNTAGRLIRLTTRTGRTTNLTYDASNRLTQVTGPFGHKLLFAYDASNRVSQMTAPDGEIYKYAYDQKNNLISITFPSGDVRKFLYENTSFSNALTGILDSQNIRVSTYGYDVQGRATSTEHFGGVDKTTLTYNADGTTSVTDPRGNVHGYNFTTQFGLMKPTALSGAPVQSAGGKAFTYDVNGFLTSRTDWNGNVTKYAHDTRGNETSRTEAFGTSQARTITTAWHATLHLPTKITEPERVTDFTYDAKGNLLTKKITANALTRTFSYTYSALGQVLTATDPRGNVTRYAYDAKGNVASITNALGHVTSFTNYDGAGRLLRSVDPNNVVTTYVYDALGRLNARTTGVRFVNYGYFHEDLNDMTFWDNSFLNFRHDLSHRLTGISDTLGNRIAYTLDASGNRIKEEAFNQANILKQTRSYAYDLVNRLTKEIGAQNQTTGYAYDLQGNLTSITDPLNHATAYAYDALNRLSRATDAANGVTAYAYDPLDHLTSVTDPRNLKTAYAWNGLDDQTSQTSPDTGATTKTYDAAGNVLISTDARGKKTTYVYDALNRRTRAVFADGTAIFWVYDEGVNGKGRLSRILDPVGSTSYEYDALGQVTRKQQIIGAVTLNTVYDYDYAKGGRLARITYPSGKQVTYAYDAAGRVTSLKVGTLNLVADVAYQPFGGAAGWTFGNGAAYGRGIDSDGRIASLALPANDNLALTYDAASRITKITDSAIPVKTFGYDTLDRLTSYAGGALVQSYGYDADGNRRSASLKNGAATNNFAYAFAATNNRLASISGAWAESFAYDASGDTTAHNTPSANYAFAYDARGRLARSTLGALAKTYGINGLGQRVVKADPANANAKTHFVYDEAGHLIGEYGATGSVIQETVWFGDLPIATLRPSGNFYVAPDHLGAPHQITNAAKQVVWLWDHDPFGTNAPTAATGFSYNLRFPGQYYDAEAGLNYNYYRDYNPKTGRYIQSDPIGLKGGMNTYAYAGGNPITRSDRLGLDWFRKGPVYTDACPIVPYSAGRYGTPVEPGDPISRFIEHNVPAGQTFALYHDDLVGHLVDDLGHPDLLMNIPSIPYAYIQAVGIEARHSMEESLQNLLNLQNFEAALIYRISTGSW